MATADIERNARSTLNAAGERLSDQLSSVVATLQSLSDQLRKQGGEQLTRVQRTATKAAREADATVHANPYAAIGAAVALGFLFGLLFTRR